MQPSARAPCPIVPQVDQSRLEPGPLRLSSSIAASASLRRCVVSTLSAASITSLSNEAIFLGWLLRDCLSLASNDASGAALLERVYLAMLAMVSVSTLSRSFAQGRRAMIRVIGRSEPVAK